MKKLYSNIEDVDIHANPNELGNTITAMDKCLEHLAHDTVRIDSVLGKCAISTTGIFYKDACEATARLCKTVCEFAESMNDLQRQMDKMIVKICDYDRRKKTSPPPRSADIPSKKVIVATTTVVLKTADMKAVHGELYQYISNTAREIDNIKRSKNNVGQIWKDTQYRIFSNVIDENLSSMRKEILILNEFIGVLYDHIQRLES